MELYYEYRVSDSAIYKTLQHGRPQGFLIHSNTNQQSCCLKHNISQFSKIEKIEFSDIYIQNNSVPILYLFIFLSAS